MRKINKNLQDIEIKQGDLIVIYRGTKDSLDNYVIVKGNIKRDKVVEKIFHLVQPKF